MKNAPLPAGNGKAGKLSQDNRISDDIESLWCKLVDEDLRAHSYVEFLRQGTLFVKVDSSCYLSALKMKSSDILVRLKKSGSSNIKNIKFRM